MCDYLPPTADSPDNYNVDSPSRSVGQVIAVYCRNVTVAVVKCMPDLKWNATVPSCPVKDNSENMGAILIIVWVVGGVLLFSLIILIIIVVTSRSKSPCCSRGPNSPSTSVFHISGVGQRNGGPWGDNPGFSRADERCGEWSFHRARPLTESERLPSYHEAILNNYIVAAARAGTGDRQGLPAFVRDNSPPSYRTSEDQRTRAHDVVESITAGTTHNVSETFSSETIQRTETSQSIGDNQRVENQGMENIQRIGNMRIETKPEHENQATKTSSRTQNQVTESSPRIGNHRTGTSQRHENQGTRTSERIENHVTGTSQRIENHVTGTSQRIENHVTGSNQRIESHGTENCQRNGNQSYDTSSRIENNNRETNQRIANLNFETNQRNTNRSIENNNIVDNQRNGHTRIYFESNGVYNTENEPNVSSNSSTRDLRRAPPSIASCVFKGEPPPPYTSGSANHFIYRSSPRPNQQDVRGSYQSCRRSMYAIPSRHTDPRQGGSEFRHNQHFRRSMHDWPNNAPDSVSFNPSQRIHTYSSQSCQNSNTRSNQNDTGHHSRRNQNIRYSSPNSNHSSSVSNHPSSSYNLPISTVSNADLSPPAVNRVSTICTNYGTNIPNHAPNAFQTLPKDSIVPDNNYFTTRQTFSSAGLICGKRFTLSNDHIMNNGPANQNKTYVIKPSQATASAPPFLQNVQSHISSSRPHHIETQPLCTSTPISQSPATDRKFVPPSHPSPLPIAHNHHHMKEISSNQEQLIFQRLKSALEEDGTIVYQGLPSGPQHQSENRLPSHYIYASQGCAPIARLDSDFL